MQAARAWTQVTRLEFLPEHAESYNQLVEVVERNLLLADWRDEHHEESMLHVKRGVWGAEMLKNLRRARAAALPCMLSPNPPGKVLENLRRARPVAQLF